MAQHNSCAWSGSTPIYRDHADCVTPRLLCCVGHSPAVWAGGFDKGAFGQAACEARKARSWSLRYGCSLILRHGMPSWRAAGRIFPVNNPVDRFMRFKKGSSSDVSLTRARRARKREQAAVELRRAGLWFSEPIQPHARTCCGRQ